MKHNTGPVVSVVKSTAQGDIIAKIGLDAEETAGIFVSLLKENSERAFSASLLAYAKSLSSYNSRSYLLGTFAGNTAAAKIYVPAKARQRGAELDTDIEIGFGTALLTGTPRLLLEGGPGSGKSTVLREIARCAWTEPARIGLDRKHIALPIKMRGLANAEGVAREDRLWSAIEKARELDLDGPPPPTGFLRHWPEATGAPWLFLLDGYDEVPAERAAEILSWVLELVGDGDQVVLSSRPNAVPDSARAHFRTLELRPFDDTQQRQLALAWFGSDCDDFLEAFRRTASAELGGTPLLITIAASVFRSTGELPYRRSELYRHFADIVCREGLTRASEDELAADLHSGAPKLIPKYLAILARSMSEGQERGASPDFGNDPRKLVTIMAEQLRSDLSLSTLLATQRAEQLYDFLGRHSGILRANANHFEWLHPTFREYFTALAFADDREPSATNLMFSRAADPSWRQVILFLLAIGSEHGSVDDMVERLAAAAPPFGLALAGVAISEGADVESLVSNTVIEQICDGIRRLGEGWICNRLLTADSSKISPLRDALRMLRDYPGGAPALEILCRDLECLAISFGKSGANAIDDLYELAASESLRRLAVGVSNPLPVRLDAAAALAKLGYGKEADDLRIALARWASKEHRAAWPDLVKALVAGGAELLALFASDGSVTGQDWADLLDAIEGDERKKLLMSLFADPRLTDAARTAVLLRLMDSTSEALSILGETASDPPLLNACLAVLKRNGAGAELLTLVRNQTLVASARVASLRALKDLCDADRLLLVVGDGGIENMLRRRAAEAACQITLTPEQAATLAAYFDGLGNPEKPSILRRRAQLLYQADRPEVALPLFQRWLQGRTPSPLMRLMHAHSLEQVGLKDEALLKYEEAERHTPGLIFANCRRAALLAEKGRIVEAADVVEKVWRSNAPDWFFPTAFLILRDAHRPDLAAHWLRDEDWNEPFLTFYRVDLSLDKGYTNLAIRQLRDLIARQQDEMAEFDIGRILRMRGNLEQALLQFTALSDKGDISSLSEQADVLIRLRRFTEADECLSRLSRDLPDDPFVDYLSGLSRAYQGNSLPLFQAAERGLAASSDALESETVPWQISNQLLFALAQGDAVHASRAMDALVGKREYHQLRAYTIPYLETLSGALADDTTLRSLQRGAIEFAWPTGWNADDAETLRRAALEKIKREPYPFPMYCQKYAIGGLEQDKQLGDRILNCYGSDLRLIVLWTIGQADRIYGHSNFTKDKGAEWNFKFCDELRTILRTNLGILTNGMGVKRLMFLQDDLRLQFELAAKRCRISIECVMADVPIEIALQ